MKVEVVRDGRRYIATVARDGARAWVHVGGHVFVIEPARAETRRGSAAADHDALSAPMPATVARINVKPGDRVSNGDVVILLEAMKMELPIRAPRDGAIAKINCSAGELVQPGVPLVELE